jgi:hypothetical protein
MAKAKSIEARIHSITSKLLTSASNLESHSYSGQDPYGHRTSFQRANAMTRLFKERDKLTKLAAELDQLLNEYQLSKGACPQCGEIHP